MSDAHRPPKAPPKLGRAGRALWRSIVDVYALDAREVATLTAACRQADDVAALEAALAGSDLIVPGSKGQPTLNDIVAELRQGRLALARLLAALDLPDEEGVPRTLTPAQLQAKKAADTRWDMQRARHARWANRGASA